MSGDRPLDVDRSRGASPRQSHFSAAATKGKLPVGLLGTAATRILRFKHQQQSCVHPRKNVKGSLVIGLAFGQQIYCPSRNKTTAGNWQTFVRADRYCTWLPWRVFKAPSLKVFNKGFSKTREGILQGNVSPILMEVSLAHLQSPPSPASRMGLRDSTLKAQHFPAF